MPLQSFIVRRRSRELSEVFVRLQPWWKKTHHIILYFFLILFRFIVNLKVIGLSHLFTVFPLYFASLKKKIPAFSIYQERHCTDDQRSKSSRKVHCCSAVQVTIRVRLNWWQRPCLESSRKSLPRLLHRCQTTAVNGLVSSFGAAIPPCSARWRAPARIET